MFSFSCVTRTTINYNSVCTWRYLLHYIRSQFLPSKCFKAKVLSLYIHNQKNTVIFEKGSLKFGNEKGKRSSKFQQRPWMLSSCFNVRKFEPSLIITAAKLLFVGKKRNSDLSWTTKQGFYPFPRIKNTPHTPLPPKKKS